MVKQTLLKFDQYICLTNSIILLVLFLDRNFVLTLDTKLGYRNVGDKDDDWHLYAASVEKRNLDCVASEVNN